LKNIRILQALSLHLLSGFLFPAGDLMNSIIALYSEILIVGYVILTAIIFIVLFILDTFHHTRMLFPAFFRKSHEITLDCLFLIIPTIIIIYLLSPTLGLIYHNEFSFDFSQHVTSFSITGHQWYWTYGYSISNIMNNIQLPLIITDKIEIDSIYDPDAIDNKCLGVSSHLIMPSGINIELLITSEDVIHSWALPQFGVKMDAVPGKSHVISFIADTIGIFFGQCSELCGAYHGFMPIGVDIYQQEMTFILLEFLYSINLNSIIALDILYHLF
jgi:cytochrome c oxidase subunit 2